jgi:hypothetical protein
MILDKFFWVTYEDFLRFKLSTVRSEHRELLMSQSVLFAFSSCNQDIDEDMSSLNIFNH